MLKRGLLDTGEWRIMKRKIALLLTAVMVLSALTGCGKKTTTETETTVLADLDTSKYVTLAEYKGIEVEAKLEKVTDVTITDYINTNMLSTYAIALESAEGTVQSGDSVSYNCVGKVDGVAFKGGSSGDEDWVTVIGSNQTIDGFEDGFIGMKVGETKDIITTFPADYGVEELNGKEAVFTVTVNKISRTTYPELTDEILKEIESTYATVGECRAGVKVTLEEAAQATYESEIQAKVMSAILAASEFQDPPQFLINQGVKNLKDNINYYATMYNLSFADFLTNYYGMTEEQFNINAKETAIASAKQAITVEAIADAEGITVTDEEITEATTTDATTYGYASSEEMLADVGKDAYRDYMVSKKVLTLLIENAIIK